MATSTGAYSAKDTAVEEPSGAYSPNDRPADAKPASTARRAADTGLALGRGIVAIPEAAVGVADIVTGGRAGKAVERLGVRFKDAKQVLTDAQSAEQKAADAQVQQADGFLPTLGAMVRNPSTIVNAAAESVPSMLAGGALSRGLVNRGLGAITAGAAGEAAVSAGSSAEQVRQESPTGFLTPKQAALAATSGAATGIINRASGQLADKLGISDVNTALATGKLGGATEKGVARRVAEGAVNEGVLQELPQSAQEQAMQNIALDRPVGEGVAQAAASGMLVGGLTGAGFGAVSSGPGKPGQSGISPPEETPISNSGLPGVTPNETVGGFGEPQVQRVTPPTSFANSPPAVTGWQTSNGKSIPDVLPVGSQGVANSLEAKPGITQSLGLGKRPSEIAAPADLQGGGVQGLGDIGGLAHEKSPGATPEFTPPQSQTRAQTMGIDPAAGPLQAAAGITVDTGADLVTQQQEVDRQRAEAQSKEKAKPGEDGKTPEPQAPAPVQPATPDPTAPVTGPFTQAIHGGAASNVTPPTAPVADPQDAAAAIQPVAGSAADAPAAPGVGADQGPQGASPVPAALPEPVTEVPPVTQPPTQESTNASTAEVIDPETGEITRPGPQGEGGDGVQRPANAVQPGADAEGTQRAPDEPAAPASAGAPPEGGTAAPVEPPPAVAPAAPLPPKPATPVDMGAHTAATSPLNDRPEPTQAQKEAGNYKKAHLVMNGLEISIENPEGSTRSGVDADGKTWSNTMTGHYGYIKRTTGSDGEQQDVYVKPGTPLDYAGPVFVVDQIDPKTGKHDEFKSMVGYKSPMEARKAYMSNYAKDWAGLKSIKTMTWDEFKAWLGGEAGKKPLPRKGKQADGGTVRGMDYTGRPIDGKPVNAGDIFATSSGRQTTPYPSTKRERATSQWLIDNAIAEAKSRKDTMNAAVFGNEKPMKDGSLPPASLGSMLEYLFGQQPAVPKSILKPLAPASNAGGAAATQEQAAADKEPTSKAPAKPTGGKNLRGAAYDRNPMLTFLAKHGLFHDKDRPGSQKSEFSPDRQIMVMGYGPVFRKNGRQLDELLPMAIQDGYLPPGSGEGDLARLIASAIRGERVAPMFTEDGAQRAAAERERMDREDYELKQAQVFADLDRRASDELEGALAELTDAEFSTLRAELLDGPTVDLDAESNTDVRSAMKALGFTDQEIDDATAQGQGAAGQDGAGRGGTAETASQGQGEGAQQGVDATAEGGQDGEGLTSPTRDDVIAQQDRAENAQALDDKAQIDREAEGFQLQAQTVDTRADTTGDMFGGPSVDDYQRDMERRRKPGTEPQGPSLFDQPAEPEPPAPAANRFEAGQALTKEQRKAVLASLVDVYKAKGAPREQKGIGADGNERYGYVHSPELFEKSDITGAMVRYYVTLPDGRIAHPSELFPNYTQADIDAEMAAREARKRDREADVRRATTPEQVFDTRAAANLWWNTRSANSISQVTGKPTVFAATERQPLTKDGKIILVPKTASADLMEAFADAGWVRADAAQQPAPAEPATQAEPTDWMAELFGSHEDQAASQARFEAATAAAKADIGRIRTAISTEQSRAKAEYDDWASRKYKANKTQVDLRGDGPSNQASMSIGAVNESRRRNAMEALAQEMSALDKMAGEASTDTGVERMLAGLRDLLAKAKAVAASGNGLFKSADQQFEYMLLDGLKFRGPGGKGNVTSNGLSKAVLAAVKPSEPAAQASAILDAANVTGKDRLDILKDVKSGALTPDEVQAAFPGVENPPEPAPKPGEVDNFGEALPPARRNMAAKLDEELSDSDIANRPLSEIWPLAENQAIEDTFAAAVAHAARAEVPSKPRVAYKLKQWVQKVKTVRELAAMIVSGRFTREQFIAKVPASLKDWMTKVMLLEQIPRDQWNRVEAVEARPDSFGYKDGQQVRMPHLSIRIDGKSHWLTGDAGIDGDVRGTLIGNMQGIRALLAAAEPEERMQFEIRQRRGGKVFINKKGDSEYRALMEFDVVADARKAINEQYAELVAAWEATKARDNITERDLRSAENRPRAGKDHRDGRDVTPEEFQTKFGFRGGEFGKWVKQGKGDKERQAILNSAYDALMDLASIAGIPPRAISLNGTLGIAFGSRGSGWASAHFEPGNLVMNLTKTRGAGALAHEWFHALDNYFSRMRRGGEEDRNFSSAKQYNDQNFITHRPEPMMVPKNVLGGRYLAPMTLGKLQAMHEARKDKTDAYNPDNWQRDPKTPEGVRPEVEARFAALVDELNKSPMTKRAMLLDGVKSGEGYWSRTLERAARAFESYVIAKMHEEGYHNDFLVNVRKSDETGKAGDRYPYLLAGEVKPIAEAFDALFDTLETAEDDAGNVAIREPDAPYETDLFGQPVPTPAGRPAPARPTSTRIRRDAQPAAGVQDTPAPAGEYFASTIVGSEVSRELGASKITTPEQAAQATTYLYKSAVERLDGIVTDKSGKPLGIVGGFKGALAQTSVYPATLVAEAVRIPGAARIWFSHNHPSGNPLLSRADEMLNQTLTDVFRGSGIEPMGLLAIGDGRFSHVGNSSGSMIANEPIPTPTGRVSVPVIERTLAPNGVTGTTISSPQEAKQVARDFYDRAKQPGLMLLNSQNSVIGWVPITDQMKGELRGTGGLNAIYRAISESNAGAAIIVHGGELGAASLPKRFPSVTPSENIAAALAKIDVRPLDSIKVEPTSTKSAAETGLSVADGPVYARGNPFYSALTAELSRVNAAAQPALGWANTINGLVKAGKVKQDEVDWSGVLDWLKLQRGKVTREQLVQFLDANGVKVTERVLSQADNRVMEPDEIRSDLLSDYQGRDTQWLRTHYEAELDEKPPKDYPRADLIADLVEAKMAYFEANPGDYSPTQTTNGAARYGTYQLPGGTNYREILLTLPAKDGRAWVDRSGNVRQWVDDDPSAEVKSAMEASGLTLKTIPLTDAAGTFKSTHWDQPNVLAHIRVNDRTDADGRRVLFIEEIQSDWAQGLRKNGAQTTANRFAVRDINGHIRGDFATADEADAYLQSPPAHMRELFEQRMGGEAARVVEVPAPDIGIPTGPFVTKTDAWLSLALKRIVKMAVDEGYDRVAFINGDQSAERYDLSKQIETVYAYKQTGGGFKISAVDKDGNNLPAQKAANEEELAGIVGKDLAAKIVQQRGTVENYTGLDLKVGGEGMKAFYNKIVPNTLKDVLRKVGGGALETVELQLPGLRPGMRDPETGATLGPNFEQQAGVNADQPGFTITPAMRQRAADGLPLFDRSTGALRAVLQSMTGQGMTVEQVQAIVQPMAAKWDVDVRVVALPADLPIKAPSDAMGLHYNGVIYIVARTNRGKAQVLRTLAHETIAHYGLRSMLGRENWRAFMRQIQFASRRKDGPLQEIGEYIRRTYVDENGQFNLSEIQEGDEIAARVVELGVDPETGEFRPGFGMLKAVFARVAEFLRGLGFTIEFTNLELQGMLVRSQRALARRAGRPVAVSGVAAARGTRIRRTIAELVELAGQNSSWKDWYEMHKKAVDRLFGDDAEMFQRILSATSQMQTVKGNVTMALRAYEQMLSGKPFVGYLPAVALNLERIRNNMGLAGPKISEFERGNLGSDEAMAVDRHIAQLLFNTSAPSIPQIEAAKRRLREVATRLGWTPKQAQAALWAANQVRKGIDPNKVVSYDRILEERAERIEEIRATYGRRGGLSTGGGADAAAYADQNSGQFANEDSASSGINFARSTRSDVNRLTADQMRAEIQSLIPRVEQAYEDGNQPLAERLDARLETLMENLEANYLETEEDRLTAVDMLNPMSAARVADGEQGDTEADLVRDLANTWRDMSTGAGWGNQNLSDAEKAAQLRGMVDDYAYRHGGIKPGVTDQQILDAAEDAFQSVYGMRAQQLERIRQRNRPPLTEYRPDDPTPEQLAAQYQAMAAAGDASLAALRERQALAGNAENDQTPIPDWMRTAQFRRGPDLAAAGRTASNTAAHYRSLGLQALGRRQITELYGNILHQLHTYNRLMAQMDADKNEVGAQADQIAKDWGNLKDERELAELMHDATLAQMDPEKPLMRGDDPFTYDGLRAKFVALSPEARQVYVQAREAYREHHENVRQAIRDRIERSELRGQRKAELLQQMDSEFYKAIKGVYFPLARFGDYVVIVRDPTGKVLSVNRAETLNEAEALQASLRQSYPGMTVGKVLKSKEFNAGRDAVGRGFMQNLYEALGRADMDDMQRGELEDMLGQLYLSALPDLSWAKHGIHRKGTPGFSQDARRAFAQNTFHGARYLAKVRYSDLLENELIDAQKQVDALADSDSYDSVKAQQVIDEMVKRHDAAMNPNGNALSTALTSVGFVFHLGLSPASAMVNLTQTALVALPLMGSKWGFSKSTAALLKASQQAASNGNDISKVLSTEERRAFDEAVRSGVIDVTMAHDLAGISQGEDAKVAWKMRPLMRWASFLFHHAEKFNRQVTFVAAYRLAREAGSSAKQAYEQAVKATYDGHFDYSASNRPRIMQGNVAKVVLLFKQYGQNMVYTLSRQAYLAMKGRNPYERAQARRALGGLLAMHGAAAGVLGLPMVSTLLAAASFLGGDDDEPWDAEVALRNMLADALGDQAADVLARGLSRLTPWDISGRVGLDKLILPDIQEGLEGQDLANSAMAAALGPVAGIAVSAARGMQEIASGNWARGLEAMAPSLARGPLKALRYGTEGAIDKTGKPIVEDVGAAGVIGQALGFSPSEVRLATEAKSAVHQADARLAKRRADLMRHYAMAVIQGDQEGAQDALADIRAFNEKNPGRRINPLQMAKSVAMRRKQIAQSEGGVYLPRSRRDAMQAGEFGMP